MSPVSCAMHLIRSKGPRQIAEQNRKKFQCIYHHLFSKCQCQLFQGRFIVFSSHRLSQIASFLAKNTLTIQFSGTTHPAWPTPAVGSKCFGQRNSPWRSCHPWTSPSLAASGADSPAPGCSPGVTVNIGWTRQWGPWGRCNGDDGLQERPLRRGKHFHQSIRDKLVVAALADQSSPAVQCFSRHIAIWLIAFSSHHYPHLWVSELWIIWEHLSW